MGCMCIINTAVNALYILADSRLAPSQWETSLQSNAVSHWLGANLESALHMHDKPWQQWQRIPLHMWLPHTLTMWGTSFRFNTRKPRQNTRQFANDILKFIFLCKISCISTRILLKHVQLSGIGSDNGLAPNSDKPLSEPMMAYLWTHICDNRPQSVNAGIYGPFFFQINASFFSCDQAALWMVQSVCPSHLFDYVPIILSSWNFQESLPMTEVTSMQKSRSEVKGQGHRV